MPYIKEYSRTKLDPHIDGVLDELGMLGDSGGIGYAVGELNYVFTTLLDSALGANPKYADYNAALGVLEAVKLELYRRVVAPYEDEKLAENGDVFG